MYRTIIVVAAVLGIVGAAAADPTVTLTLQSSKANTTVTPGTPIDWTIYATVSTGDNAGLALVSTDLVQATGNAVKFDLPPATGVPASMANFSRPAGISNPGEGGATTGYIGVQRGTAGEMNLVQIGGGQNTFGQAGDTMGTNPNVVGGIGQSGAQIVATGTFNAPTVTSATTLTFSLTNAIANVIVTQNSPPNFSPVTAAAVNLAGGSFNVTVALAPQGCPGDYDCDHDRDFDDIKFLVAALGGEATWSAYHVQHLGTPPTCGYIASCDSNGDGIVDFDDIKPFVSLIGVTCP